jgi:hypothetical protein
MVCRLVSHLFYLDLAPAFFAGDRTNAKSETVFEVSNIADMLGAGFLEQVYQRA